MSSRKIVLVMLSAFALTGCESYRPAPPTFYEAANKPYTLDAGDRVRLTVFGENGLTNTYNVDQGGTISVPLIGSVPVRSKTTKQVEAMVTTKLRDGGFLLKPSVSVEVDRYRPIFVMGEVGAAGQYSYVPGMTAQKAIAAAGGFTSRAGQETIDITRQAGGNSRTERVPITTTVLPGDTIYVRERFF